MEDTVAPPPSPPAQPSGQRMPPQAPARQAHAPPGPVPQHTHGAPAPVSSAPVAASATTTTTTTAAATQPALFAPAAGTPLLPVEPGAGALYGATKDSIKTSFMRDGSDRKARLWGVSEAYRELVQNITDAAAQACFPPPRAFVWTSEPCATGVRLFFNGNYAGEIAYVHDGGTFRVLFYNRGRAMPAEAWYEMTSKTEDVAAALQLAGGFGRGMKDAMGALLRDGAARVLVHCFSPNSAPGRQKRTYTLENSGPHVPLRVTIAQSFKTAPAGVKLALTASRVPGTVVSVEYTGVAAAALRARLEAHARVHWILAPRPAGLKQIAVTVNMDGVGLLAIQLLLHTTPHAPRLFLSPGLLYASAPAVAALAVDVIVPGSAVRLNSDRTAQWQSVGRLYGNIIVIAAEEEMRAWRTAGRVLPSERAPMLAALADGQPLAHALAHAVWDALVDGAPLAPMLVALVDAQDEAFVARARALLGGWLFAHYTPMSSRDELGTAVRMHTAQRENAALLGARVLIREPLLVGNATLRQLLQQEAVPTETLRLRLLAALCMPATRWRPRAPADDVFRWTCAERRSGAALPAVYALDVDAALVRAGAEWLEAGAAAVLVFSSRAPLSTRAVFATLLARDPRMQDVALGEIWDRVVPEAAPVAPPAAAAAPRPVHDGILDYYSDDDSDYDDDDDSDYDDDDDDDSDYDDDDDSDDGGGGGALVAPRAPKRRRLCMPLPQAARSAAALFLDGCADAHARALGGIVGGAPVNVRAESGLPCTLLCVAALPQLVQTGVRLTEGSRRHVYAPPAAGAIATAPLYAPLDTYFNAVHAALERLRAASPASAAAPALELEAALAPPEAFVVGNVGGRLFVNVAHARAFARSDASLLLPLAHAVSHNRAEHDAEARLVEETLVELLGEDAVLDAAHVVFSAAVARLA